MPAARPQQTDLIGCPAKRSGNMPHAPERQLSSTGAMTTLPLLSTPGSMPTPAARKWKVFFATMARHTRWARSRRTHSAFTTWQGTFGSGPRTVTTSIHVRLRDDVESRASKSPAEEADRIAIERLHEQDVEATLSDKADELARLWDNEAVRIQPGRPAEIGKAEIYANDKRWESKADRAKTLCYKSEIKDVQIAGGWAFEWGYLSYKDSSNPKPRRGKVLRVMKRQPDGS